MHPVWKESDVHGAQLSAQTDKLLQNSILMHTNFPNFRSLCTEASAQLNLTILCLAILAMH